MALRSRLFMVAMLALAGCGGNSGFPKTYPVKGTVKLNGKPVENAMVSFQKEGGKENAIGTTDKNGEFTLSMFNPGDGAVPGKYLVAIKKEDVAAITAPNTPPPGQLGSAELSSDYAPPAEIKGTGGKKKSEIPDKYTNTQTSGLIATVSDSQPNNINFDLK